MNILLTSAGRRTYMVEYFREALSGEGLVFASNSSMSPALRAADGYFITPLIYTDEYIPFLLDKCLEYRIDMLITLFDADLPVLAANRDKFLEIGVFPAFSDMDMIRDCNDKLRMFKRLEGAGIGAPLTAASLSEALGLLDLGLMNYPLIVKPRFGMGSIGLFRVFDDNELAAAFSMCGREVLSGYLKYESERGTGGVSASVIVQQYEDGTEYGLDVISDFEGNYLKTIVRRKLAMRSGETDEAVILGEDDVFYAGLTALGAAIAKEYRPKGLIDVDVIIKGELPEPKVIDINARFGGGYPFSHLAGANVPAAYILFAEGKSDEAAGLLAVRPGVYGYKEIVVKILSR